MNLRQLEMFGAVMSTGTTVGASRMLNVSQPAVSQMILHMEDQLKFKLFHRQRGRLVPTQEAELLYLKAQKVFEAFDATSFVVDQIKGKLIGELRIVSTPALGTTAIPQTISRFREGRPEVKVSFEAGSLDYVLNSVEIGRADLGVHFHPLEHPLFNRVTLGKLRMVCIFPKEHPLAQLEAIRPEDLAQYPFITASPNDPVGAIIENSFKQANVEPKRAIEVRYFYQARDLVALGEGVALVESYLLTTLNRYPELTYRTYHPEIITTTAAIHLNTRPLSALAQIFLQELHTTCQDLQKRDEARTASASATRASYA